VLWTVTMWY